MQRLHRILCHVRKTCMKSILLIASTSLIILSACNKNTESGDLTGTWELTQIHGMLLMDTIPDRFKEILSLDNETYQLKIGDETINGTYSTAPDSGVVRSVCLQIDPGKYTRRIDFSQPVSGQKVFYQLDGSTLKFISGCFANDGGVEKVYKRIAGSNR